MRICVLVAVLAGGLAAPASGQSRPVDLASATLEDLMQIEITSASRRHETADDVPAAVYVITRDDIRRSGMTSIPDLLRLVPGVQVARINSNKWAISIRGFSGLYSNKLLVLVDGRTIYNPLFASVMWDTEDVMLEDVERIEIIRGPGAAVWGSTAVNGIINILTKNSASTRGLLVRGGAGTVDRGSLALRYGGTAGASGAYRVFAQLSANGDSVLASGDLAGDHWRSFTTGFRGDWKSGPQSWLLESSISSGEQRPLWTNLDPAGHPQDDRAVSRSTVGNVLGRWARTIAGGDELQVQSFFDLVERHESIGDYHRRSVDLEAVYHTARARRHNFVAGGGFRVIAETMDGGAGYSFAPRFAREALLHAFAQDEIALPARLELTLGAKVEHESDDGGTLQPTARLLWKLKGRQHVWAAASRALRTPSLVDKGVHIDFPAFTPPGGTLPVLATVDGNPLTTDEQLVATEAGYRIEIAGRAAFDVTAFASRYRRLQTVEPADPTLIFLDDGQPALRIGSVFGNLLDADARGAEVSARIRMNRAWQVVGTWSAFDLTPRLAAESRDRDAGAFDGHAPARQWRAHSALALGGRIDTDLLVFHAGPQRQLQVPGYTRVDARVEWKFGGGLSASLQGQNLLRSSHAEFAADEATIVSTLVRRTGAVTLSWRF